jgi:hypothetical protein
VKRILFYGLVGGALLDSAITFMEVFPVGLIVTLVSAGILRRKPREGTPVSALPA